MIFVGSKVFTHARYWQIKKYVCMIFFCGGHLGGGAPRICGGHVPPPRPPPPVATPLLIPEPSLTFPFIPPCLCKFIEAALRPLLAAKSGKLNGSLFNYPTYLGKIEAYFQIKFSRACVNNFFTHEVSYERKNYGY